MRWREIRAGVIAIAIFLALVEGCPIPPPHETLEWQQRYVSAIRPVQRAIMTPFRWLPKWLRITERFALFQAAEPDRFRLEISARAADGTERLLFRALDDEHQAFADSITHRRVRGVWNPTDHPTSQYAAFAKWLATKVFAEQPDAQAVTFRMMRVRIDRGTPRDTGTYAFELTRYRGSP